MTSHFPRPTSNSIDDAFDLSHIFIGRDHQLDQFEIYLNRWEKIMFDADLDVPAVMNAPSPDEKIQGLVVLLYGRGGFGKSTLLRRYRDILLGAYNTLPSSKVIASAVVDWENAAEGRRSLFNLSPPKEIDALVYFNMLCVQLAIALGKNVDDFKHYQRAVKEVENARKQAIRVIETIRDDQGSRSLSRLTSEGVVALLRLVPYVGTPLKDEQIAEAIKGFVGEGIDIAAGKVAQLHAKLHDKLGTRFGDYLEPDLKLGLNLGYDLREFAKDFPLLIFFDTYEEIDEGDHLLRIVMGAAGLRVGWILTGRDNLWAGLDQRLRSRGSEYGYKELVPSDRGLAIDFNMGGVGAFTPSDLKEYFDEVCNKVKYDSPLPQLTTGGAKRIWDVTWGIPLAIRIAAGIYLETANLTAITGNVKGKHEIIDQMVRRYLIHVRDDESDRAKLYGLIMLRRTDQPIAVATALGLMAEQAKTGSYAIALSRLHRRYSFIFTDKDEPTLHQEVRHFLRLWLLERRAQPEIIAINKELKNAHELALQQLEDQRKYNTLKERMQDDDWVGTYLDLIDQQFWLDPVEGLFYILPFMFAAAIYNRDVNEDTAALGMFFEAALGAPYRNWLIWANQSLVYLQSSYPSDNELHGSRKVRATDKPSEYHLSAPFTRIQKRVRSITLVATGRSMEF